MAAAVAIGAGLAAALLYLVARQPGFIALVLTRLGPLPIMIATLGFGPLVGLTATVVGTLTVAGAALAPDIHALAAAQVQSAALDGLFFALGQGLPACGLGYLLTAPTFKWAALSKAGDASPATPASRLGWVVVWAAAVSFLVVTFVIAANCIDAGSYEAVIAQLADRIQPLVQSVVGTGQELPRNIDVAVLARLVAEAAWPAVAGVTLVTLLADLWLAARVVQISNRLPVAWPNIPRDLRIPRLVALAFAVALGACFAGGVAGAIATVAATALGVAFAIQGLATVHELTRGASYRTPLLCLLYLLLVVTMPWPLAAFALIGLLEAGFSLRDRKSARHR